MAQPRLLLVNYHYIRPRAYAYPGIHPLAPDAFRREVDWLAGRYHMASIAEAEAFFLNGAPLPGDSVLLTFDDGLVDHAIAARDVLEPRGIGGVFFVCTRPLTEGRALAVHKIHWLRATTEPGLFLAQFHHALPYAWRRRTLSAAEAQAARETYVYDDPDAQQLKYMMNFVLPDEVIDEVTSRMLESRGVAEPDFARDVYMDAETLRSLERAGHRVGAHTHDHRPVTRHKPGDLDRSMRSHVDALGAILGHAPTWFSYPFGRDWAVPDDTEMFARAYGFRIACTLQGTWVEAGAPAHALPRINTNEIAEIAGPAS